MVVEFEVGRTLASEDVERWASLAEPGLADREVILAMHAGVRIKPATELAIITPARVILVETRAGAFKFKLEYRLEDVSEVRANPGGSNGQIRLVMTDGDKQKFGTAGIRNAKADAVACAAAIERARQHPDGPTVSQALPPADEKRYAPTLQPERVLNKLEAKSAELDRQIAERRATSHVDPAEALADDTQTVGGTPSAKVLRVILEHSLPDEHPWLVLNSGIGGVLAAYEDRLMIIKTGGMTSLMAGSWGGGRTATFHYPDVTGIEYNSGLANGVLEVLTPSYSGGAQKDYWRGTNRSRNADSNDPFTMSNTLPLARALHSQALPHLNELRSKIAASKRTVAAPAPQGAGHPPSLTSGLAAEIAELSALRDTGALTEEEFAAAKARLLGR